MSSHHILRVTPSPKAIETSWARVPPPDRKVLLEYADPPAAIRELIAAYRSEMEDREPVPEDDSRK